MSVVVLSVAGIEGLQPLWAAPGSPPAGSDDRAPLELRVTGGAVTGAFEGRALSEVLDALAGEPGFEYEGAEQLLAHRVSGRFEAMPVIDAVSKLLEPFNYIMTFDEEGRIQRLLVSGLSAEPGEAAQAPVTAEPIREEPVKEESDLRTMDLPPGMTLTEEQYRLFEEFDPGAEVPPELSHLFDLDMPPGAEETGPPLPPGTVVREMPPMIGYESDTGPPGPDISTMELPEFTPYESETGPDPESTDFPLVPGTPLQ